MSGKNIFKIKSVKSAVVTLVLVIAAGIVGAWSVNILVRSIIHDRREVIVPEIEGMPLEDALEILSDRNLSLSLVARKYDPDIPSGSVISQTPPPGLMVREGGNVEAVISSGGQVVFVPEVVRKSLRETEMIIRQAGLQMGEQARTYSRTVEEGYVVSQTPSPDEVVSADSYVDIVISMGPVEEEEVVVMPDIKGMRIRNAERFLQDMNFQIAAVRAEVQEELPEGTVLAQKPEAGTEIEEKRSVDLVISRKEMETLRVREETVRYEVGAGEGGGKIEILLSDDIRDEYPLHEGVAEEGEVIEIPVRVLGKASAEVIIAGEPVAEYVYEEKILPEEMELFFPDEPSRDYEREISTPSPDPESPTEPEEFIFD